MAVEFFKISGIELSTQVETICFPSGALAPDDGNIVHLTIFQPITAQLGNFTGTQHIEIGQKISNSQLSASAPERQKETKCSRLDFLMTLIENVPHYFLIF